MAPILHDPSFVVIPFLQLEIGLNGELYKNGINIKSNILQKNCIEFNLDRQNYFNSELGRYYDISLADFRKQFYGRPDPDFNLESHYGYLIRKMKISDISGDIVFVKDVYSNLKTVGNANKTTDLLREIANGFANALDVSGAGMLDTGSYMKLIKWIGLENNFSNPHKLENIKKKFTSLTLREVASEMASKYDKIHAPSQLGAQTFQNSFNENKKWGNIRDWKIFDAVSALYDTSSVSDTESFDPYSVLLSRETACRKKTVYFAFSIIIHDLQSKHTITTTTTSADNSTTTTTTSSSETVTGPIQLLLYFRTSASGNKSLDDYFKPTAFNTNYGTIAEAQDVSSTGFNIVWNAFSNDNDFVVKNLTYQLGVPGSVITSTDFPNTIDSDVSFNALYEDPSNNAWNLNNNPDVSGVALDTSKNYTGYHINQYDLSANGNSHLFSDLSSNTYYSIRTFAKIGNMRNTEEDISMAIVTHKGVTKPFLKQIYHTDVDNSNNYIFSDISQNPATTDGDVIGLTLRNIDGNVAIKKITVLYTDICGNKRSQISNDSGTVQLGNLQINPRVSSTEYSLAHAMGNDYTFDISFIVQNIFDVSSIEHTLSVTSGAQVITSGIGDISQNIPDSTSTTIYLNFKNQTSQFVNIKSYVVDYRSKLNPDISSNYGRYSINSTNGAKDVITTDNSLNGLTHANCTYDISYHFIKTTDTSSNIIDASSQTFFTRPGTLRDQDVTLVPGITTKTKIYLKINNLGNAPDISGGMFDISGYIIKFKDFSGNDASGNVVYDVSEQRVFADTSLNSIQGLYATDQSAIALDVPFLVSQANWQYDISLAIVSRAVDASGNFIQDISSASMSKTFYSRPDDFDASGNDISQNNADTSANTLMMKIHHTGILNSADISGYTIDYSSNTTGDCSGTQIISATIKDGSGTNIDVSLNDLSANTTYDLSVNLINVGDLSNNKIASVGTTRPTNFVTADVSQNLVDTSANSIIMKIHHPDLAGTLDISGYTIDYSSNTLGNQDLSGTILKTAVVKTSHGTNNDVSLNDLSANVTYDLSICLFSIVDDLSNNKIGLTGSTRPSDFTATDVSQNNADTSANTLVIKIAHKQIQGSLDISGYVVDYSGNNGSNATSGRITKTAMVKDADGSNNDVSLNDLSANTTYDLSVCIFNVVSDLSNAKVVATATTRPSNYVAADISQNLPDTSANTIVLKIHNSQIQGTLDISGYEVDYSGNNGTNASSGRITKTAVVKSAHLPNNDVSLNDLSANTTYDLSVNLIGSIDDLSNAKIVATASTRPANFTATDVSQNNADTSANTLVIKINHKQLEGTLDISGYVVDYSGNNGSNATSGRITKTAVVKDADGSNNDVSLNDLSANTTYDLSVCIFNVVDDLSNAKVVATATTRPSNYVAADVSQNLPDTSANTIVLKIHNSQIQGTLDISGYEVDYSGNNGANATSGTIIKTAVVKTAHLPNNDVSLNDLSANTTYDLSVNLIGSIDDLSNAKIVATATTRPSDYVAADVSQNLVDTSANTLIMKIHNSQIQGTLDISGYEIDISGTSWPNAQSKTVLKTAVVKSAHLRNIDVSLNDLSANTTFDLSVNLIGSIDDLSNAKIVATATTRPANFVSADVSQNLPDTSANTLMLSVNNAQIQGTLDISGYDIDISGTSHPNAQKKSLHFDPTTKTAHSINRDVSLNDLSANTTYELSFNLVGSIDDLSNATIGFAGTTRPTNFVSADVSQNLIDTSANTVVMKIKHKDYQGTLDISGYTIDISATSHPNGQKKTVIKTTVVKSAHLRNNDVSLNDLSANTTYDLSVCSFNVVNDLSNTKIVATATTRPSNYVAADVSQNLPDTSANTIVMKIHNSQIQGTLDISGYEVDYSGNNGANATSGRITKTAVVKTADASNVDVSLNDLSANTTYDLSVNLIGSVDDLSNAKIVATATTRPADFTVTDVSQNNTDTSANTLVIKINHKQVTGTLDISGYVVDYSGNNGSNATSGRITKTAVVKSAQLRNNDVSLNDLSANTTYDLSVCIFNVVDDLSNAKVVATATTRPSNYVAADVSQNLPDTSANTLMLSANNAQIQGTLDISGYDIDISGTSWPNAQYKSLHFNPTTKTAHSINRDVSLNDLSANTTYELSFNLVGSVDDLSNATIGFAGTTRPTNFVSADVSQNLPDTSANTIVIKINHKDYEGTLDISGYTVDYSGNNGSNATSGTITKIPVVKSAHLRNDDVSLNDLSANTTYDLSVCSFNIINDLSNTKIVATATTRPSNYVAADVSQNLIDTSANTLMMKIHNSQISGTLDISGYEIDYSGNNGLNASSGTIIKTAVVKTADASNVDVSLNDLSANTTYDLSVNLIGSVDDLSNAKIVATATTRPADFTTTDVSQNNADTSANTLVIKINHKQIQGSLDISGYVVDYSGNNGANATSGRITKTAVVNSAHLRNNDVSLNDLSANTTYDLSVCIFNVVDDLSNAKVVATATTRPSNYVAADVSQNLPDTSANTLMLSVNNAQIQGTLDISGYDIDISGTSWPNAQSKSLHFDPTTKTAHSINRDVSLNDLSANTTYELSFNLVGSVDDLSNATIGFAGTTRPTNFVSADVSQNLVDTSANTVVMKIKHKDYQGTLDISGYTIDYSGNNGNNATSGTITKIPVIKSAHLRNNDVSLNDLSANTTYDLSVCIFNVVDDLSNAKIVATATTRPSNYVAADVSQNLPDTSANTIVLKIHNSQIQGTLDISGYEIDYSGNNSSNASSGTIIKTALVKSAHLPNNDVSLNDLSANTTYDLSVNLIGSVDDLSNAKIVATATTRPTLFATNGTDVSQNTGVSFSDISINRILMSVKHKDVEGTLDISGYLIKYKVLGGNNETGNLEITATNKNPNGSNADISLNNLQYPNAVYDMSVCLFNTQDMSNTYIDISGLTKPRDFNTTDVSNNAPATTSSLMVINVNNNQPANTVDISEVRITTASGSHISKKLTDTSSNSINRDISFATTLLDASANTAVNFDVHLINIHDMSNSKVTLTGVNIRPRNFDASGNDVSQNLVDTSANTLVLKINNNQDAFTLDISFVEIDYSGNNGTNATSGTIVKKLTDPSANKVNNDVSLNDLSANTTYDLSVNLFNTNDISNSKIAATATTRPANFVATDISQNNADTSANTLMLSVSNAQVGGTLDISGYDIDISGTNGVNASTRYVHHDPTNKTANAVNRDVSLNDLSANTTYELSFNIVGSVDDLSNASIGLNGTTRPADISSVDVSQNNADTSANTIVLKIAHKQVEGTLDISGYTVDFRAKFNVDTTYANSVNLQNTNQIYDTNKGFPTPSDPAFFETGFNVGDTLIIGPYLDSDDNTVTLTTTIASIPTRGNGARWYMTTTDNIFTGASTTRTSQTFKLRSEVLNTGTITKIPVVKSAHLRNNDVSLNDLSENSTYDLSVCLFNVVDDLSNAKVVATATTRPSNFAAADICQNMIDSSANTIVLKIHNSQLGGTLDISGYEIDYSCNGIGVSSYKGTILKTAIVKTADASNVDVSLNDLSANMLYELSCNLIGSVDDLSNAKIGFQAATAPTAFASNDVSQNFVDTSANTIVFKIHHPNHANTLDISAITVDYSGNNGANASSGTITKIPVIVGPTAVNNDVSFNDLSANTFYDLSINLINSQNIDGDKIAATGYTLPKTLVNADCSQNLTDTSANTIVLKWNKGQIAGSADISGFIFDISGHKSNGTFYDGGTILKTASNKNANGVLTDISINSLVANTRYDFSGNMFNIYDMSQNVKLDILGTTRPADFDASGNDISQNYTDLSKNRVILYVNHAQPALSLDISGYTIKYSALDDVSYSGTIVKNLVGINDGPAERNNDISLNFTKNNIAYDISVNLFSVRHDLSNSNIGLTVYTQPSNWSSSDVSANVGDTSANTIMLNVSHSQEADTADISGYKVDVSCNAAGWIDLSFVYATNVASDGTNSDVSLNDLSANMFYDISINMWNKYDYSNNRIAVTYTTRPASFSRHDISQNVSFDTSANTITLKINKGQAATSLDISAITIDYSGNNGANASSGTVIKKPSNSDPNGVLLDVSLNDISANTRYDLSINLINVNDISSDMIDISAATRPSVRVAADCSQNLLDTSANTLVMKFNKGQIAGTLDISGFTFDISAATTSYNSNAPNLGVLKTASNQNANGVLTDISLNNLTANTYYDLSVNMINIFDLSTAKIVASGTTRPATLTTNDISQNAGHSSDEIVLNINNTQPALSLDISGYYLSYDSNNSGTSLPSSQNIVVNPNNYSTDTFWGDCDAGSYSLSSGSYDGSYYFGGHATEYVLCGQVNDGGMSKDISSVSFWFKLPDDSADSTIYPMFRIKNGNQSSATWCQLFFNTNLMIKTTTTTTISKLYVDGTQLTLPALSAMDDATGAATSPVKTHTSLRGWHHYYVEFGEDIPEKPWNWLTIYDHVIQMTHLMLMLV